MENIAEKTPNAVLKASSVLKERNKDEGKRVLPPYPLKVPPKKFFGYPERYKSPTDSFLSPISRGLLARNRRPARTMAPVVPPKALENTFENVVVQAEESPSKPPLKPDSSKLFPERESNLESELDTTLHIKVAPGAIIAPSTPANDGTAAPQSV